MIRIWTTTLLAGLIGASALAEPLVHQLAINVNADKEVRAGTKSPEPTYRIHRNGTVSVSVTSANPSKIAVRVRKVWISPMQPMEEWIAFATAPVQPSGSFNAAAFGAYGERAASLGNLSTAADSSAIARAEQDLASLRNDAATTNSAGDLRGLNAAIAEAERQIALARAFHSYDAAVKAQKVSNDTYTTRVQPGQEFTIEITVVGRDASKPPREAAYGAPTAIVTIFGARSSSRVEAGIGYGGIFGNNSGYTVSNGVIQDRRRNDFEPAVLGYVHFVSGDRSAAGLVRGINGLTGRIFSLDSSNTRVAFSLGTPLAGTRSLRAYVLGATLLLGENQEIGVTMGAAVARYDRLANGFSVGQPFAGTNPPMERPVRVRPFIGLSYSFR